MKRVKSFSLLFILCCAGLTAQEKGDDFFKSANAYLGQTPPGNTPVLFAPAVLSAGKQDVNTGSFSADGKTFVFTKWVADKPRLVVIQFENGRWTEPKETSFTGKKEMEGIFAPTGNRLVFAAGSMSGRWAPDDLWMTEKQNDGWSNPVKIDALDSGAYEFYATQTLDGTVFFQRSTDSSYTIYYSIYKDNAYQTPIKMDKPINASGRASFHPGISPDGSYLLMELGDNTNNDLWVSFKNKAGVWSDLKKLGATVNTMQFNERMPVVSPDGKYLFFTRTKAGSNIEDIYWVSTSVVRALE